MKAWKKARQNSVLPKKEEQALKARFFLEKSKPTALLRRRVAGVKINGKRFACRVICRLAATLW